MSNPEYKKRATDEPWYEGPRAASREDFELLSDEALKKIGIIFDAMEWQQLIIFRYGVSDRLVAPFVIGISSEGNPLLRGFQLEGESRSGKGNGWRVFQIEEMESVANSQDFFDPDLFDFDEFYPWVYKVFKML